MATICAKTTEAYDSGTAYGACQNVAPNLVEIALDTHGTRALQTMIEYCAADATATSENASTQAEIEARIQVSLITDALRDNVVRLIQDINGNHVVQKCLNNLVQPQDTQFIIDAVSANCVIVGKHKHGCCVLQRCIDFASDEQRQQLVAEIIAHAHELVRDQYGNYVVQYVLDLNQPQYSEPLVRMFFGSLAALSQQSTRQM